MRSTIGVYDTHEKALNAVSELKGAGYPTKHLSILGKAKTEILDNEMHIAEKDSIKVEGLAAGTVIGTTLGILTGVGIFAIPGVGFLYGAGALIGAIAGLDIGLIGGGLASILETLGVKDEMVKKYHKDIEEGRFLLVAQGTEEEVDRASTLLHTHGTHEEMQTH